MSTLLWYTVDSVSGNSYSSELIPIWNALMRGVFLILVVLTMDLLKVRFEAEEALADNDGLTGLKNRRAFLESLGVEVQRAQRMKYPMTLVYIDLDNFKWVNDNLGHHIGDEVLITVAGLMRLNLRGTDICARLGGDEFGVLLPQTSEPIAKQVLMRLQATVNFTMEQHKWPVTCSIGIACFSEMQESPAEMIEKADGLMYAVKKSGRNGFKAQTFGVSTSDAGALADF